jgi:CRP/FNR family cyclic AMP-dependent transcriptional regulator
MYFSSIFARVFDYNQYSCRCYLQAYRSTVQQNQKRIIMSDVHHKITTCTTLLREDITDEECEILAAVFELKKLAVDDILLREGQQDDTLYIVVDGDFIASREAGAGEYVTLHHLKAGDIAGAMGFVDGNNHSATLRAAKESHVLTLHRDALEGMLDEHPHLVYKIMTMIVRSVHQTLLRMNQQFVEMNNYIMKEHGRY